MRYRNNFNSRSVLIRSLAFVVLLSLSLFPRPDRAADKEELINSLLGPPGSPAEHLRPYFVMQEDAFCFASFQKYVVETLPRGKAPPRRPPAFCTELLALVKPSIDAPRNRTVAELRDFLREQPTEQLEILDKVVHHEFSPEFALRLREWNAAIWERAVVRYSVNDIQRQELPEAIARADAAEARWNEFRSQTVGPFSQIDQLAPELKKLLVHYYADAYLQSLRARVGLYESVEFRQLIMRSGAARPPL